MKINKARRQIDTTNDRSVLCCQIKPQGESESLELISYPTVI